MSGDNTPYDPSATPSFGNVPNNGGAANPPQPADGTPAIPTPAIPTPAAYAAAADAAAVAPVSAGPLPPENVLRGFVFSLVAIPAGVLVFTLIWNLGFIASIVGFGVAFAASFLYRLGSGGRVTIKGATVVTLVTVGTLIISFIFANVSDVATAYSQAFGISWLEVMLSPDFPPIWLSVLGSPEGIGAIAGSAALTLLFGLLGCFAVLRGAFRDAKAANNPTPPTTPYPPITPPAA